MQLSCQRISGCGAERDENESGWAGACGDWEGELKGATTGPPRDCWARGGMPRRGF